MSITTIAQARQAGRERAQETVPEWDGDWDQVPDPLSGEWAGESIPEIFGSWDNATESRMDAYEDAYANVFAKETFS